MILDGSGPRPTLFKPFKEFQSSTELESTEMLLNDFKHLNCLSPVMETAPSFRFRLDGPRWIPGV
jgi:hypothetical protein